MGQVIKKEFEIIRTRLHARLAEIPENMADIQPEGFNNNIRWNIGHLLLVTENFLFPGEGNLPALYTELFAPRTKPADWSGEVPTIAALVQNLEAQYNRMLKIPNEKFDEKLAEPILGNATVGELAVFGCFHESYHLGQIMAMKRTIEAALAKTE
ncbi:DinB family protein [Bacillus tuaregi]|uniref:DinB family protein n=1 Tax=Bacillus tuaregi TaxID=1816695 RepID=UPI0008F8BB1D|nr:DinB family protein [Bacillus tuaregi]